MIPNRPIIKSDIVHAEDIFGANIGSLQGKTTRKKLAKYTLYWRTTNRSVITSWTVHTWSGQHVHQWNSICNHHLEINTFWNGRAHKKWESFSNCDIHKTSSSTCERCGCKIQHISGDGQFKHIKKFFADTDINLNITGWNKHVLSIEWFIRTIKEECGQ